MVEDQGQERGQGVLAVVNDVGLVDGLGVDVAVEVDHSLL